MILLLPLLALLLIPLAHGGEIQRPADKIRDALRIGDKASIRAELASGRLGVTKDQLPLWAYKEASLRVLRESGISLYVRDSWGMTPLHIAAYHEEMPAVRFLINYGLQVNDKDDLGRTALFFSAGNITPDIAKFLLSQGAYVDCQNQKGITALMYAARQGNDPVFVMLLSAGANPRIKDCEGRTVHYDLTNPEPFASPESIEKMRKHLESLGR